MTEIKYYAHTAEDAGGKPLPETSGRWQPLKDHLQNAAALARRFAEATRPGDMKGGDHKDYYEKYYPTWRC